MPHLRFCSDLTSREETEVVTVSVLWLIQIWTSKMRLHQREAN